MEDNEMMNIMEVSALIDWLRAHGHTEEEIIDCIQYIAGKPAMEQERKAR